MLFSHLLWITTILYAYDYNIVRYTVKCIPHGNWMRRLNFFRHWDSVNTQTTNWFIVWRLTWDSLHVFQLVILKKIGVIAVCVLITLQVYPMYPSSVFKGKYNIWLFFFVCILTYNIIMMNLDLVFMLIVCMHVFLSQKPFTHC